MEGIVEETMKRLMTAALAVLLSAPLSAGAVSQNQRELGEVALRELAVKDGKVIIRVDSGGCTDKAAIKANVRKEAGARYVVTFERVRVDDCKAMLFDGIELEYDLSRDLGITGNHTLAVTNRVLSRSTAPVVAESTLKRELVASTLKAIDLEIRGYEKKLKTAQSGNVETLKGRIAELEAQRQTFRKMNPDDYAVATSQEENPESVLGQAGFGPVTPARKRTVTVAVQEACKEGSLLPVEGTSKSGPFFHIAGIAGSDYKLLKPGTRHELTLYLVYKREYFGFIQDHYVYIAEVK